VHPLESSVYIVLVNAALTIMMLPIVYGSIAIAYALSKAYPENYWFAFSFGTFFITLGAMLGAVVTFFISRYFLAKFFRKSYLKANKNIEVIDQVVREDVRIVNFRAGN